MTNQQINIAVAELCGWTDCVFVESIKLAKGFPPLNNPPIYGTYENGMAQLPDYCNDLNAMHEAEKVLGEVHSIKSCEYDDWLQSTIEHDQKWRATARQRAEAFLKTIGKWEGAK
jgi:hypothetical protein